MAVLHALEEGMRVQLKIEGGIAYFPGLSRPRVIESDKLSKEEAAELVLVGKPLAPGT
jgi:hypothetical protein